MEVQKITQLIRARMKEEDASVSALLNEAPLADAHDAATAALDGLIDDLNIRIRSRRHDTSSEALLGRIRDLGQCNQRLDRRLHAHIQALRRNEGSLAGAQDVLEFDVAKSRSDRLVEVINAKNTWSTALRAADLTDEAEQHALFNHLVELQQANAILTKTLETRKDQFFGWSSPAILFALDSGDINALRALKDKYEALGRAKDYKQVFGAYVKNKMSTWINANAETLTLWNLLAEWFAIWKAVNRLATQLLDASGAEFVALAGYEGARAQDAALTAMLERIKAASDDAFGVAHEIANVRREFIEYARADGEAAVVAIAERFFDDLFERITDDYATHVRGVLATKIDKIAQVAVEKAGRRHDWLAPLLEEVYASLRNIVNEAAASCGPNFSRCIVPSFEKAIDQLNTTLRKASVLTAKSGADVQAAPSLDALNDRLVCVCAAGYLVNMIADINAAVQEAHATLNAHHPASEPLLIKNRGAIERHIKRVVTDKVAELAATLAEPMTAEMLVLKQQSATAAGGEAADAMALALPTFSVSAHSYITAVGHGLLSLMNTIAAYNTDSAFRAAVGVAAGADFNEDECDLWMLRAIVDILMARYVANIGDVSKLPVKALKQFHADTIFLRDALHDLRLEASPSLMARAEELAKAAVA